MKTLFVINPRSGRNARRPWLAGAIRDFVSAHALDARIALTEGPGHATELAREAVVSGHALVVAVGGDGTMNEVAQALVEAPAALALVPCGSGNGLALHLGIPRATRAALELARGAAGRVVEIDTGVAAGRPFFNAMGLGLDADVSRRFNRLTRRGLPAYVRVAYSALRELRTERCTISADGLEETLDVLLIAVANSDQYGNNARIAPGARVDDGRLDLVAVKAAGLCATASLVPRMFLGTLDRSPHVRRLSGTRFTVRRATGGLIHTDGETHAAGACVEIEVRPRSLRVLIPARSQAVGFPPAVRFVPADASTP